MQICYTAVRKRKLSTRCLPTTDSIDTPNFKILENTLCKVTAKYCRQ